MLKKFWNTLKSSIKTEIKNIYKPETQLKLSLSSLNTGILFLFFSIISHNSLVSELFSGISIIIISVWVNSLDEKRFFKGISKEYCKLLVFIYFLHSSLSFCITNNDNLQNRYIIIRSVISAFEIFYCSYYLISKSISIFKYTKNIFNQIKKKLFNSIQTETTKLKSFIENITALLTSIVGLIVIIKAIVEPLINLFR